MGSSRRRDVFKVLSEEKRTFSPPNNFKEQANISDYDIYDIYDFRSFWEKEAKKLHWFEKWKKVLDWDPPYARWFVGGRLNASYNCLDRHLEGARKNKAALIWEGEPGERKTYTYKDLHREVNKFASVLKEMGVEKGDIVTICLPMIPETAIAMLACARIGAPHSVVFAGLGADALAKRIRDANSRILVTSDGYYRRGKHLNHKEKTDRALEKVNCVKSCIVVERSGESTRMVADRDHWWKDLMHDADSSCPPEWMGAEDELFIMYTSGTTGRPKGVVHTTGGYLTHVTSTSKYVFDLKENDTYWCTSDMAWINGHSYIIYGILSCGATTVIYEGAPDYPDRDRFWKIVEKYGVNIFYTAPTAIRSFMKWGKEYPEAHDISSLRLLGSVGEPLDPRAWMWYYRHIGREKCPIVDTWWQTETGGIMLAPLPGVTETRPGSVSRTIPGISADVLDDEGQPADSGYLAITKPWPGMLRTIYNDDERYRKTYWSKWNEKTYFSADGARKDSDGYIWILGRVDDIINVSGHSLSTMEIESALVDHELVAEAAVVGGTDKIRGQAPVAYVILQKNRVADAFEKLAGISQDEEKKADIIKKIAEDTGLKEDLTDSLKEHVARKVGAIATPRDIHFVEGLPRTKNDKIMRRLLEDITESREVEKTASLKNPAIVKKIQEQVHY